jgi:hypothetical protein
MHVFGNHCTYSLLTVLLVVSWWSGRNHDAAAARAVVRQVHSTGCPCCCCCCCPVQVYITPLLGAYLADAVMGRFWVILVFSLIYFVVSLLGRRGGDCKTGRQAAGC